MSDWHQPNLCVCFGGFCRKQYGSCSKSKSKRRRKAEADENRRLLVEERKHTGSKKKKKGPPILVWRNPDLIEDTKNGESSNE